jgi:hypothetical protein
MRTVNLTMMHHIRNRFIETLQLKPYMQQFKGKVLIAQTSSSLVRAEIIELHVIVSTIC